MAYQPQTTKTKGSVIIASVIMLVGPILLFFLPVIGSFVAGVVGGKVAGTVNRAVLAALLPAIAAGIILAVISAIGGPFGILLGAFAAFGVVLVAIVHGLALLLGAVIGGLL